MKITLVFRGVVYLRERNMHQKKTTRQLLITLQRIKSENEKVAPYLEYTQGPKRNEAMAKRTKVRIAGSRSSVIAAPTIKEVETSVAHTTIIR